MVGFIPHSRASLTLDIVATAMIVVIIGLCYSVALVKQRRFTAHKRLQLGMGIALLMTLTLFEIDVRLHGWKQLAAPSPYYDTWLFPFLGVHLFFAISATLLWTYTTVAALRRMPNPPGPSLYGPAHRKVAWIASGAMFCTAITGGTFYWMAFLA